MKLLPKSIAGKIRFAILVCLLVFLTIRFVALPLYWYLSYNPQNGDIIFQSLPRVELVRTIEGITESPYSHCGVVVNKNDKWSVTEALVTVHDTSLFFWIIRGRGCKFVVYRLNDNLNKYIPTFLEALRKYEDRPYDYKYQLDDDYIYCSELVFKSFKDASGIELGNYIRLGDMNWEPYVEAIREFEGGEPPLDRLIISPKSLSKAKQLTQVFTNR